MLSVYHDFIAEASCFDREISLFRGYIFTTNGLWIRVFVCRLFYGNENKELIYFLNKQSKFDFRLLCNDLLRSDKWCKLYSKLFRFIWVSVLFIEPYCSIHQAYSLDTWNWKTNRQVASPMFAQKLMLPQNLLDFNSIII